MRKVSETVITAFLAGKSKTVANTWTDGETLFLHGNKIATNQNGVSAYRDWETDRKSTRLNSSHRL